MTAPLRVIALRFRREAGSEDRILAEAGRLPDMFFVAEARTAPSNG
jgi:hypothetical protein